MNKVKRILSIITILTLIVGLLPTFTLAVGNRGTFERTLDDSEMRVIVGAKGDDDGGGSGDDDSDKPTYIYEKKYNTSMNYGTASLEFIRSNYSDVPVHIGKTVIDTWTITGSFSGDSTVYSVFNISAKFEGSKTHTEKTSSSFTIPAKYCMKIYTKPYTETTKYYYTKYKKYNGRKTQLWQKTGTYKYSSKKVTYTGYSLN